MNHVLVDFENVPTVDLAAIGQEPVKVILLIGEKQRRLELKLVQQIHQHADKVTLVEVGASGRNALDLVLAWHLGKTAERHPEDVFFVISRDKDYDPLIRHLRAQGVEVARVESFAALPFVDVRQATANAPAPRRSAAAAAGSARRPERPVSSPAPRTTPAAAPRAASAPAPRQLVPAARSSGEAEDERLRKLSNRLQNNPKARPVRRKTLLSHINGYWGNKLSEPELEKIVATLESRGIIRIDDAGRVNYGEDASATSPS